MQKNNTKGYIFFIGGALMMMSMTLSSYGIATVTPALLKKFDAMQYYTLTSLMASVGMLIVLPIAGKLVDTIGRKPLMIVGGTLMLVSSIATGLATNFAFFVVMRALVSISNGLTTVLPSTTLPFHFDRDKLPKLYGIQGAFLALGTFFGSTIAGWFGDMGLSWVAVAYPGVLSAIGCAMMFFCCPEIPARAKQRIDFVGLAMVCLIIMPIMFFSSFGKTLGWLSPAILASFVLLVLGIIGLLYFEKRITNPLINLNLFKNKVYTGTLICAFLMVWYQGVMRTYVPLVIQNVMGQSAAISGSVQLPRSILNIIFPTFCGLWVAKNQENRRWKAIAITGGLIAAGFVMLCFTTPQTSVTIFFVGLGLTGLAECFKQSSLTPTLQATLKKEELGSGMSLNSMAGTLGSTLSVCLCGVIQSQIAPDTSVVADLSKACNIIFFTCVVAGVLVILLASTLVRPSKKAEA